MFSNFSFTPTKREDEVQHDEPHPDRVDEILARLVRIETRQYRLMVHLGLDPHEKTLTSDYT